MTGTKQAKRLAARKTHWCRRPPERPKPRASEQDASDAGQGPARSARDTQKRAQRVRIHTHPSRGAGR